MIQCVECNYLSRGGLLHYGECRLMLLQWIHIEGKGENLCEFDRLSPYELQDLAEMENEMLDRGAALQPDGYFGKCVPPDADLFPGGER